MKKILILTSKTGGGHDSLTQAIKEGLEKKFQVEVYDGLPRLGSHLYFYIHHWFPTFFNLGYQLTNCPLGAKILHLFSFFFSLSTLRKIPLEKYDLIFSVQPFLTTEVAWLIKKPKLAVFINDPVNFHQVYLCPQADLTFVATQKAKKLCLQAGLSEKKVIVCGFPVRKQFFQQKTQKKAKKFTVFIGGSGYGLRETKTITRYLTTLDNLQLIVVCGRHRKMRKKIVRKKNIKVFGFVKNMAKLMSQCHLVVGKAGPNLLFESITLGIPFLATGYPPEQEKGNLRLIEKYKIGWVEKNPKKAATLIYQLAKNPKKLEKFKVNIKKFHQIQKKAPQIIAAKICELLKEKKIHSSVS